MKKLDCILLIDDDPSTNFLHKLYIEEANCAHRVVIRENGKEALEFLREAQDGEFPCPELIFLDINMPRMNGWEFLEEYKNLDESQKGQIIIVMLTTSLNPDDQNRATQLEEVSGFENKPLSVQMIGEILETYFQ